jgi:hypothetical protein
VCDDRRVETAAPDELAATVAARREPGPEVVAGIFGGPAGIFAVAAALVVFLVQTFHGGRR